MPKKISVEHLRTGMFLHGLCGAWTQHPFWRTKFVIKDQDQIRQIIDSGITEVLIDADKGLDVQAPPAAPPPAPGVPQAAPRTPAAAPPQAGTPTGRDGPTSMSEELKRATKICAHASRAVSAMFREARMGNAISSEVAGALVDEISSSVMRNPGALISMARLKTVDDYTYMHSVAVCALMVALSRQLGLTDKETRDAGMAGLMHDLGKAMMPPAVLNKPGKLTDEEFRIIKTHPERGHQILVEGGGANDVVLDVCLHHHEKVDGSGYPHGLTDEKISVYAKMGAVCDVYDAITSNRPYKAGWDPAESLRKMTEWSKGHFDLRVFQGFVKSVGIYPTGSLVRLSSGRLAVVVEQSRESLLKPIVRAFYSTKSKVYLTPELIDLSRGSVAEKIAGVEDPVAWGLKDLEKFWMS